MQTVGRQGSRAGKRTTWFRVFLQEQQAPKHAKHTAEMENSGLLKPNCKEKPSSCHLSFTSAPALPILCLLLSPSASSGYSLVGEGTEKIGASLMSLKKKTQRKLLGITVQTIASVRPALRLSNEMHFLVEIIISYRFVPLFCCSTLQHCVSIPSPERGLTLLAAERT